MSNNYCVYKHTSPSNKVYIGITSQKPENRWNKGRGYRGNDYFAKAINKYGWDNFKHEILYDGLSEDEANKKEIELIEYYKSNKREFGYNIANGGNCAGMHSEESKKKMSENNYWRGKKIPYEIKKKISDSLKGREKTDSERKKLSDSHKGKTASEETKKKLSESHKGEKNYWYGKKLDNEIRKKMSESTKNPSYETRMKRSKSLKKRVSQFSLNGNFIAVYDSGLDAEKETGILRGHISSCCTAKTKTAGGYIWKYYDID